MNITTKRIVIHTGPGKTGSSALQAWLSQNIDFLNKNGIDYPAHSISKEQISSGNLHEILERDSETGKWSVCQSKLKKLISKFKQSDFNSLLLSSEFFFPHIVELHSLISEAEFVVYIRHPLELCESNYNQGIKRHSAINKFQVPKVINNTTLKHLQSYFKRVPVQQFKLRPYDFKLMHGGGIVSDLLSVLGVETKVESSNINPSFTFPALEFKRLLNHFDLKHLEPQLDQALQACYIGETKYSFMDEGDFARLNHDNSLLMQAFIDDNKLPELQPLYERFKQKKQRPYKNQEASLNDLTLIADYIKVVEPTLYNELKLKITDNPNIFIDNLDIYNAFSVEVSRFNRELTIDERLLKYINNFTIHPGKRGKVCFELSCYHFDIEDYSNALIFANAAHYFNPNHKGFKQKLNQLLIKYNKLNRASKIKFSDSFRFNFFKYKVKSKLNKGKK